jgi:hypothetical protein
LIDGMLRGMRVSLAGNKLPPATQLMGKFM